MIKESPGLTSDFDTWFAFIQRNQMAQRFEGRINFRREDMLYILSILNFKPTAYMLFPCAILPHFPEPKTSTNDGFVSRSNDKMDMVLTANSYRFSSLQDIKDVRPTGLCYLYEIAGFELASAESFEKEYRGIIRYAEVPFELVPKD